jgi:hypothetical protein
MAGARSHEVSVDAIYGARFNARHTQREAGAVVYVARCRSMRRSREGRSRAVSLW